MILHALHFRVENANETTSKALIISGSTEVNCQCLSYKHAYTFSQHHAMLAARRGRLKNNRKCPLQERVAARNVVQNGASFTY